MFLRKQNSIVIINFRVPFLVHDTRLMAKFGIGAILSMHLRFFLQCSKSIAIYG